MRHFFLLFGLLFILANVNIEAQLNTILFSSSIPEGAKAGIQIQIRDLRMPPSSSSYTLFFDRLQYNSDFSRYNLSQAMVLRYFVDRDFTYGIKFLIRGGQDNVVTDFEYSLEELHQGIITETKNDFEVLVIYQPKIEVISFADYYCTNDESEIPVSVTKELNGNISGTLRISDGDSSTSDYQLSLDQTSHSIDLYDLIHMSGKELTVTFSQPIFPNQTFRGLYVIEPIDLSFSFTQPTCSYSTDASIRIDDIPYSSDGSRIRINLIKYFEEASFDSEDYGDASFEIFEGDTLYWYDEITQIESIDVGQTSLTFDNNSIDDSRFELTSGYYKVEAFYLDGSVSSLCSNDYIVYIEDKAPLELSLTVDEFTSSGGTEYQIPVNGETVTIGGSVSGNQGGYSINYEDENGNSNAFTIDNTLLGQGDYTFLAADNAGCVSDPVSLKLKEPGDVSVSVSTLSPNCNSANTTDNTKTKGKIKVKVTAGGIPNFYAACYQDEEKKASISSFSRNKEQTFNLPPGTYTLKIWDNGDPERNGIPLFEQNYTISVRDKMTLTATPNKVSCNGGNDGEIALQVSNGTSPFSYTATGGNSGSFTGNLSTHTINELSSGTYTVTVTDKNGCYATETGKAVNQPSPISVEKTDSSPATCELSDGSLTFEVSGGWTDKVYSVSLEEDGIQIDNQPISAGANDKTVTFEDLPAGTDYIVTVTNDGECSTTPDETFTVEKNNPLQEALSLSLFKKESCANNKDAKIFVKGWDDIQVDFSYSVDGNSDITFSSGYISGLTYTKDAEVNIYETEGRQCEFSDAIDIEMIDNPISFDSSSEAEDATCSTASNGSITAIGHGGVGTIQYKLDDGDYGNTSIFEDKAPGTYTVSIKDDAGCVDDNEFVVGAAPNPVGIDQIVPVKASCATSEDGEIQLRNMTHDGGLDMTLTYKLGDVTVSSGEDFSYSDIGTDSYSFTLKDANNCFISRTVNLGHNGYSPDFTASIEEEVACTGKTNGRVLLDANGIVDDYTFHLYAEANLSGDLVRNGEAPGTSTFVIDNLGANPDYSVEIIDAKGCVGTAAFDMPILDNSLSLTLDPSPASCDEVANGELRMTAEGGFPFENGEYQYSYEMNEDGDVITNQDVEWNLEGLALGDYLDVAVQDKYGCITDLAETIVIKNDPTEILQVFPTNPACNGASTGSIDIEMQWTPATTDYAYDLYKLDDDFNIEETYSGTLDEIAPGISTLSAGNYELKVTDTDGCSDEYNGIQLIDPDPVTVDVKHNYIRIKDENTGEFSMEISGGNNKYEVGWASLPEGDAFDNTTVTTNAVFAVDNLPAGHYMLALRDTAHCPYFDGETWFTSEIEIVEPEMALGIAADHVVDVSCNKFTDGQIAIEAEGGWGPYSYELSTGEQNSEGIFEGLTAGSYAVVITDTAGVSFNSSYQITEPDTLNLFIDEVKDATCPLYANGQIRATTLNGVDEGEGLYYRVENLENRSESMGQMKGNRDYYFGQLTKGNYELFVTDAHQCVASKEFAVGEPDTAQIAISHNYIRAKAAHTGEISSMVSEGNHYFDYQWYKDDDPTPFETGQTTGGLQLSSLGAGTYTLMVRDTAGCVYEDQEWMVREIILEEPDSALNFLVTKNQAVSCYGREDGFLEIKPVGGWGDYLVKMDEASFSQKSDFSDLDALVYNITVMDSAGIEYSELVEVTEPDTLRASLADKDDILCFGGSNGAFSLDISGGNLAYLVSVDGETWVEGNQVDNLPKGLYTPQIKDTLGCAITIDPVQLNQPDEITLLNDSIIKSRCSNNEGSILASFQGGVGEYDYTWYQDIRQDDGSVQQVLMEEEKSQDVDSLFSGRYQVVVTDAHQCEMPFEFFVGDITDLAITSIETRDVWCWGYTDGEAVASVSKGNPPYYYTWSQEVGSPDGSSALDIPAGNHQLMVTDSKNCKVNQEFTVGTPDSLSYDTIQVRQPLCLGGQKGMIHIEGKGGTSGYTYSWDDGTAGSELTDLTPGTYEVTMTDSHDCSSGFALNLNYERTLKPDIGADTTICHYDILTLDGGDYNRFWWSTDNGQLATTRSLEVNTAETYFLKVEDGDQCLGFDTLKLDISTLEFTDLSVTEVTCANAKDGSAEIAVNASEDNYTIIWPDTSDKKFWNGLSGGEYSVRIENPLGCFDQQQFVVPEPDPLSLTASIGDPLCYGVFDGELEVTASGGNGDYQYDWSHGSSSSAIEGLKEDTYTLDVIDAKDCRISDTYELFYTRILLPDLGDDISLCSEAEAFLSPGTFHGYQWFLDGQPMGIDSLLVVSDPGSYVVEVSDEDDCLAYDTLQVAEKLSDLKPEFLMATSVPLGDTLMIVDVTTPKPSSLAWAFSGEYDVVSDEAYFCEVIFRDEGLHTVTLSALQSECVGQTQKQILVTPEAPEAEEKNQSDQQSSVFNDLKVSPNPSDGNFRVEVELKESATVNLYLVRLDTGQIFEKNRLTGLKSYSHSYHVGASGQYVVFAESGGERLMKKVIVY